MSLARASSSGNSPVAFFEYTTAPSKATSNTPPEDLKRVASIPAYLLILAAKLAALGS